MFKIYEYIHHTTTLKKNTLNTKCEHPKKEANFSILSVNCKAQKHLSGYFRLPIGVVTFQVDFFTLLPNNILF